MTDIMLPAFSKDYLFLTKVCSRTLSQHQSAFSQTLNIFKMTNGSIAFERKRYEPQFSARQIKLAELMLRYLQAREEAQRALDEVRSLHRLLRENGADASAKMKSDYRSAVSKLCEFRLESNRHHTDLLDALSRSNGHFYSDRRVEG